MLSTILIWVVVGIIAGWLTGLVVKGRGFGLLGDLVIGLLGGIIGGLVFGLVGLAPTSWLGQIVVSFVGGVILVALIRLIRRA
jgi:uncharacterized membrane protein YeaQ/YmgE (transglycosylase-associated protein family)